MSKHTAGPWVIIPGDEWGNDIGTVEGENTLGETLYWTVAHCNSRRDEVKANARLISKAPEMLEILKEANEVIKGQSLVMFGINGNATTQSIDVLIEEIEGKTEWDV